MIVDVTSTKHDLLAWHQAGRREELTLSPALSATALITICKAHRALPHEDAVLALVAETEASASDEKLRQFVLTRANKRSHLANTLATNSRTNESILQELSAHPDQSVREHAFLALLSRRTLHRADAAELHRLLDEFVGDLGIALGVRWLIAQHRSTPREVLLRLLEDEADHIAAAARVSLAALDEGEKTVTHT